MDTDVSMIALFDHEEVRPYEPYDPPSRCAASRSSGELLAGRKRVIGWCGIPSIPGMAVTPERMSTRITSYFLPGLLVIFYQDY